MIERDQPNNELPNGRAWLSSLARFKSSGTILAATVLIAAALLSIAMINRYRLRQARQLLDQGQYHAGRLQLDAMLPLFAGDRTAQYHRVMHQHFQQLALPLREAAEQARRRAEEADAPRLAHNQWFDALNAYDQGNAHARQKDWAMASQSWEYATEIFDLACGRAEYARGFLTEAQKPLQLR
jgi:hypothetical protein